MTRMDTDKDIFDLRFATGNSRAGIARPPAPRRPRPTVSDQCAKLPGSATVSRIKSATGMGFSEALGTSQNLLGRTCRMVLASPCAASEYLPFVPVPMVRMMRDVMVSVRARPVSRCAQPNHGSEAPHAHSRPWRKAESSCFEVEADPEE